MNPPNTDAVAPSAMKTMENPATNHRAWSSAVPRFVCSSSTDMPVRKPT